MSLNTPPVLPAIGESRGWGVKVLAWLNYLYAKFLLREVMATDFGYVADYDIITGIGTDNTVALRNAVLAAEAGPNHTVHLPSGDGWCSGKIPITESGVCFNGNWKGRIGTGASRLIYTGNDIFIEIGTDDGLAHDSGLYDGPGEHMFHNVSFWHDTLHHNAVAPTPLLNGTGANYGTDAIAIMDWRGGSLYLEHVLFENFEVGVWGVQSDINNWVDVEFRRCHVGVYLDAKCDQFKGDRVGGFFNDTLLDIDRCLNATFYSLICTFNGSATTPPVRIRSSYASSGSVNITFNEPWFETGGGYPSIKAYIEIGIGDVGPTSDEIRITNPLLLNLPYTGALTDEVRYLCRVENCTGLYIENPAGYGYINLNRLIEFVGNVNTRAHIKVRGFNDPEAGFTNSGIGTPTVSYEKYDSLSGLGATMFGDLFVARRGLAGSGFAGVYNARTAAIIEGNSPSGVALSLMSLRTGRSIIYFGDQDQETIGMAYYDHSDNTMVFVVNGVERLRIGSNGQIILGAGGTGPQLRFCTGTPEGAVTAPVGSICLRDDGGIGTAVYLKVSGVGSTGWVNIADTVPPRIDTHYYGATGGSIAAGALAANTIYFTPIYLYKGHTIDRFGIETTGPAAAGKLLNLGLYSKAATGLPGNKLVELAAPAAADVIGAIEGIVAYTPDKTGWYYLATVSDGAPTVRTLTAPILGIGQSSLVAGGRGSLAGVAVGVVLPAAAPALAYSGVCPNTLVRLDVP